MRQSTARTMARGNVELDQRNNDGISVDHVPICEKANSFHQ